MIIDTDQAYKPEDRKEIVEGMLEDLDGFSAILEILIEHAKDSGEEYEKVRQKLVAAHYAYKLL